MEVSSSTQAATETTQSAGPLDVMKNAQDVQEQQLTKILESATEQSKQVTAQKTGIGNSINITG